MATFWPAPNRAPATFRPGLAVAIAVRSPQEGGVRRRRTVPSCAQTYMLHLHQAGRDRPLQLAHRRHLWQCSTLSFVSLQWASAMTGSVHSTTPAGLATAAGYSCITAYKGIYHSELFAPSWTVIILDNLINDTVHKFRTSRFLTRALFLKNPQVVQSSSLMPSWYGVFSENLYGSSMLLFRIPEFQQFETYLPNLRTFLAPSSGA